MRSIASPKRCAYCCFMTLAILIFNFYPLTAVMIVMLALLNDGAILSIAYDNVHYKNQPEAWNMRMVLGIATVLGCHWGCRCLWLVLSRRARLSSRPCAYPDDDVFEVICRRASDDFSYAHARPILVHTSSADFMDGCAWHANRGNVYRGLWVFYDAAWLGLGRFVWGYALIWALLSDRIKLLAYRFI